MKKIFCVLFILLALQTDLFSQSKTVTVGYRVSEVKTGNGKTVFNIQPGAPVGISAGAQGEVWGIHRETEPGRVKYLGTATVTQVARSQLTAECACEEKVLDGDLVFLASEFPDIPYRSPYHYLVVYAIELLDDQSTPLYTFAEVHSRDGQPFQTEKFLAMEAFIRQAGARLAASGDRRTVTAGPNRGKLVSEILQTSDTLAIWNYLYFKSMSYMTTMGQTYRFSQDYAAYVEEGDLVVMDDFWERLLALTSDTEIEKHYRDYERRLSRDELLDRLEKVRKVAEDGDYEKSGVMMDVIVRLARLNGDEFLIGQATYLRAAIHYTVGEYAAALPLYREAAEYFARISDNTRLGSSFHYIALSNDGLKDYDGASQAYIQAVEYKKKVVDQYPDEKIYIEDLYSSVKALAELQLAREEYAQAEKTFGDALALALRTGNKSEEAGCRWNLGFTAGDGLHHYDTALAYYKAAAALYLELQDTASAVQLIRNQGLIHNTRRNYGMSLELGRQGVQLAKAWGNSATLARIQHFIATTFEEMGKKDEAVKELMLTETAYADAGNNEKLNEVRKKIAGLLAESKRFREALKKHEERLSVIAEDDAGGRADVLWDMAYISGENLRDDRAAIRGYSECLAIYRQLGDTSNMNIIYSNLAYHYRTTGDSVNAYRCHEEALRLTAEHSDKLEFAYAHEKAAATYGHFRRLAEQRRHIREAIKLYISVGEILKAAKAHESAGETLSKAGLYSESATEYATAIALYHEAGDKPNEAETYWDYAYVHGNYMSEYEKAIALYHTAFSIYMEIPDSVNASVMLSNIGQTYWSLLNYEKAIEYHRKAIELASKSRNMKQVAKSWSKLATLYTESNNPVASFEALKNSLSALIAVNDSLELAATYNEIGNSYFKAKDYTNAFSSFEKAIAIRRAKKDDSGLATALYDLASGYHSKYDFKNATRYYLESLQMRRELNDREGEIFCLANLGTIEQAVNADYRKSQQYLDEAIRIAKEIRNEYIEAYCYGRLKGLYRSQGNAERADECNAKALKLFEDNKRWKDVASTLLDIGYDAYYVYGDVREAMSYFDRAQAMIDTLNDSQLQAVVYSSRSSVYRETGEFDRALDMATKSLDLYNKIENSWGVAGTYIDLGNIYKQRSEFTAAIECQNRSDSLYQVLGLNYARLAPLANLGENYAAQGDYKKGLEYYHQSLAIMEHAGDLNENLAIIKACVGEAHFYLNEYADADRWLKESIAICEKVGANRPKADNLSILGRLKIEERKYAEALKYLNEGLQISKSQGITISMLNNLMLIGKAEIEQGHYEKAKGPIEECVRVSKAIGKRSTLWESLYLLGLWYRNAGDLQTSRNHLKESVEVIEQIRNQVAGGEEARKAFSSDKQIIKVYDVLIDVLLQLGETEEAMSYLQRNNEANLKAKFKSLDVQFEDEKRKRALEEERIMKAKLDGIEEQIAREKGLAAEKQNAEKLKNLEGIKTIAESEYLKFINQQINVQPQLSRYFNNSVQPTQFRRIKKQIPADMALLSYLAGENQLYIFAATSDTVVAKIVTVPAELITRNINAVLNITKSQLGSFLPLQPSMAGEADIGQPLQKDPNLKPFEELYHYLIRPVANELKGKKRLGIIPTGSLNYIPFQLLGRTMASGKFRLMANDYSVFYTSSTDMLFRMINEEEKEMSILAFANPDKSLPSTEVEVQDIKRVFPDATVYIREEATEDKAKFAGEEFNVMHFATHGNLDYEDFSKSFLTMAGNPAKAEDGMLTLEELWGMDVMNHLNIVVLSACETAVTKGSHENSPVSPASGFLQNGVKSVVATLWKVDDHATSLLISDFYKNLRTMDAVDALRSAQVSLSQKPKYAHPYYWAGIVLLGDWR